MGGNTNALNALKVGLTDFAVSSLPPRRYRFSPPDKFEEFERGLIALTPPRYFNDPFEAWAGISTDNLTAEDVVRSLCSESGIFYRALKSNNPAVVSDRMSAVRTLESLVRANPELWEEHLATCVNSVQHTISEPFGVSCFSAFSDDDLTGPVERRHWAMYAMDHSGFAVEFDGQHSFFTGWTESKWMFPGEYRMSRLLVPLAEFDDWADAKMWKTFRHWTAMKSRQAWGHESEWRILCPISEDGDRVGVFTRERVEWNRSNLGRSGDDVARNRIFPTRSFESARGPGTGIGSGIAESTITASKLGIHPEWQSGRSLE